jgi:hypothetical protein
METVVLVSVLSTLGAVALVISIVVAFIKLKKKVDVEQFVGEVNGLYDLNNKTQELSIKESRDIHRRIDEELSKRDQHIANEIDRIYREMDSRLDKINHRLKQIETSPNKKNKKELITG